MGSKNNNNVPNFIDLDDLEQETATAHLYNNKLEFKYRTHSDNPTALAEAEDQMRDLTVDQQTIAALAYMIDNDIVSWNLTLKGEPIPLVGAEVVKVVKLTILQDMAAEISEMRSPKKRHARRS